MNRGYRLLFTVVIGIAILAGLIAVATGHVTSTDSACSDSVSKPPTGSIARERRALVPQRPIVSALLCRYQGEVIAEKPPVKLGSLASEVTLGTKGAARIARWLNLLPKVDHPSRYKCPVDLGARIYIVFSFLQDESVVVRIDQTGCQFVNSPGAHGLFESSIRLQRALQRMTPTNQ